MPFYLQVSRQHAEWALCIKSSSSLPHASSQTHPSTTHNTTAMVISPYTWLVLTIMSLLIKLMELKCVKDFSLWRRLKPAIWWPWVLKDSWRTTAMETWVSGAQKGLGVTFVFCYCSSISHIMPKIRSM